MLPAPAIRQWFVFGSISNGSSTSDVRGTSDVEQSIFGAIFCRQNDFGFQNVFPRQSDVGFRRAKRATSERITSTFITTPNSGETSNFKTTSKR